MTEQEKSALLQFMGTVYGDAHKQDQMIVGQSGQLQPNSHVMKQQFEQVLRSPTEELQQNAQAPAPMGPVATPSQDQQQTIPVQVVDVQQAAKELAAAPQPAPAPAPGPESSQLEFDLSEPSKLDKLIDMVKQQNLLLKQISLKLDNGKKPKDTKKR